MTNPADDNLDARTVEELWKEIRALRERIQRLKDARREEEHLA